MALSYIWIVAVFLLCTTAQITLSQTVGGYFVYKANNISWTSPDHMLSWADAFVECAIMGQTLMTVPTWNDIKIFAKQLEGSKRSAAWIGTTDAETNGVPMNTNGEIFSPSSEYLDNPSFSSSVKGVSKCAQVLEFDGKTPQPEVLRMDPCSESAHYICQTIPDNFYCTPNESNQCARWFITASSFLKKDVRKNDTGCINAFNFAEVSRSALMTRKICESICKYAVHMICRAYMFEDNKCKISKVSHSFIERQCNTGDFNSNSSGTYMLQIHYRNYDHYDKIPYRKIIGSSGVATSYQDAVTKCAKHKEYLLMIESPSQDLALAKYFTSILRVRKQGQAYYSDNGNDTEKGNAIRYENWKIGEPHGPNECVNRTGDRKWQSIPCDTKVSYQCEKLDVYLDLLGEVIKESDALQTYSYRDMDGLTIEECAQLCMFNNNAYSGTQEENCFCYKDSDIDKTALWDSICSKQNCENETSIFLIQRSSGRSSYTCGEFRFKFPQWSSHAINERCHSKSTISLPTEYDDIHEIMNVAFSVACEHRKGNTYEVLINKDVVAKKIEMKVWYCPQASILSDSGNNTGPQTGYLFLLNARCLNGGTAIREAVGCICSEGYAGSQCQSDIDECASNPCGDSVTTVCADTIAGYNCKNTCKTDPCLNNSTCSARTDGKYRCECLEHFVGIDCEVDLRTLKKNPCSPNPCLNGGTCEKAFEDTDTEIITCQCRNGFSGNNCETNEDDCVSEPCLHGGVCRDMVARYFCDCPWEYFGKHCENETEISDFKINTIPPSCDSHPCQNKGACVNRGDGTYKCICQDGFYGIHCEREEQILIYTYAFIRLFIRYERNYGNLQHPEARKLRSIITPDINKILKRDFKGIQFSNIMLFSKDGDYTRVTLEIASATTEETFRKYDVLTTAKNALMEIVKNGTINKIQVDPTFVTVTEAVMEQNKCMYKSEPCKNGGTCHDSVRSFTCTCTKDFTGSTCEGWSAAGGVPPSSQRDNYLTSTAVIVEPLTCHLFISTICLWRSITDLI